MLGSNTKISTKLRMIIMLLLPMLSIAAPFMTPSQSVHALTINEEIANDDKFRDLKAMRRCVQTDVIDSDDEITDFSDMFHNKRWAGADKNGWDAELAIVGFNRDNKNAVVSCKSAIEKGLQIMGEPSSFLKAITGGAYSDYEEAIPADEFEEYRSTFYDKIGEAIDAIPAPTNDYVYQRRFFNSAANRNIGNACFRIETSATSTLTDRDFKVTLKGDGDKEIYFYFKGNEKMRHVIDSDEDGWINDDGIGERATRLGDIQLPRGIATWESWYHYTFPVGSGYDKIEESEISSGIPNGSVSCSFAKTNKDWLFGDNVKFSGGKLDLSNDAIVGEEHEAAIDKTVQDKIDAINEAIANTPDGDNIFAFCTASVIQKYADYPDISALDGDLSAIKDYIIAWLAAFRTDGADVPTVPWSNDEALQMIACLTSEDAFGTAFGDLLDLQPEDLQKIEYITAEDPEAEAEEPQNCKGGSGVIDGFLGFIICPVVELVLNSIEWAQNTLILPYLAVNPLSTADDSAVYQLWKMVRNLSYVFLIVAFMYLIFSQTTSFGGEAYQLKRMAPRLVMVTIGISLSYYIVGFIIDFFNILGVGIAELTTYALGQTGASSVVVIQGGARGAALTGLIGTIGAAALVTTLLAGSISAGSIGIAALAGIVIVLGVIITLTLRQVIILALTILTPLALVAALLPNTEKYTKMWWSYLSKALVMYPFIVLLFASGKIFGALITTGQFTGGGGALASLMSFMANVAPLVLVPFTFKMAGGAIGGFYGAMRGAVGKGRNAMMGDPHNPNSIRGRRSIPAQKWANRFNRANEVMSERGGASARVANLAERALHLSERANHAQEEEAKRNAAFLREDNGKGMIDELFVGEGVDYDGEVMEGYNYVGDHDDAASEAAARGMAHLADRHENGAKKPGARARRKNFGHLKNIAIGWGQKFAKSDVRAQQFAAGLNARWRAGDISTAQANEIWGQYTEHAASNGNKTVKEMKGYDDSGELSSEFAWRNLTQESAQGRNGDRTKAKVNDKHWEEAVKRQSTIDKAVGKMDSDATSSERPGIMDWQTLERAVQDPALLDKHRARIEGFVEKAEKGKLYNSGISTEEMRARDAFVAAAAAALGHGAPPTAGTPPPEPPAPPTAPPTGPLAPPPAG